MTKPKACEGCPWEGVSYGFLPPQDNGSDVTLVGDHPRYEELRAGRHFAGRAGDVMNRAMRLAKVTREDYNYAKVIQCAVPLDLLESEDAQTAIRFCRTTHLAPLERRLIVPMGISATRAYLGVGASDLWRGYTFKTADDLTVYPMYCPYFVGEGHMARLFTMRHDLLSIKEGKPWRPYDTWVCNTPDPKAFEQYYEEACVGAQWIIIDIETDWSAKLEEHELTTGSVGTITRISFCTNKQPHVGTTVPFKLPWTDTVRKILNLGYPDKVYWNIFFDKIRLELAGFAPKGRQVCAMHLWHFLQPDLPQSLAHTAPYFSHVKQWKSLYDDEPEYYSAADAYVEGQCYLGICDRLEQLGMAEIADAHVTDMLDLLERMSLRGMRVDREKLANLRAGLQAEVKGYGDSLRTLYPESLLKIKWYKKTPKEVKAGAKEGDTKQLGGKTVEFVRSNSGDAWGVRWAFNPNSADQLKDYIKHRGWKVPFNHKTKKDTTGEKFLKRIVQKTGDPLLGGVLEWKKREKIVSTYTVWPLDNHDFVHPQLRLTPASGRLSCVRPNWQNIPKDGPIAAALRACIVARVGHLLVAADFTGLESFITGYLAGDELYMKLASKNIYVYVMAKYNRWNLPDIDDPTFDVVTSRYKEEDKERYRKFKSIVLGIGYLAGPRTLYEANPGVFESIAEATQLRRFFMQTFPLIDQWQQAQIARAGKEKRLFNPWRYVRWFFDVPGSESAAAVAQEPQSIGAAIVKDDMLIFDQEPLVAPWMVLQIHDELIWDVPEPDVPRARDLIHEVMSRPRQQLGGHGIMVKVKVGPNLRDLK